LKEHIDFLLAEPAEESERNGKESCRAICGSSGRGRCFNILNHADAASARHLLGEAVNDNPVARCFRRLSDDEQIYRQALEAALKKLKNEK
jgi:hypothetical protein